MRFRILLIGGLGLAGFGCAAQSEYAPPTGADTASITFVPQDSRVYGAFREELRVASGPRCEALQRVAAFTTGTRGEANPQPRSSRVRAGETVYLSPIIEKLYNTGHVRCASVASFRPVAGHAYRIMHRYDSQVSLSGAVVFRCAPVVVDTVTQRVPPDLTVHPVSEVSRCVSD